MNKKNFLLAKSDQMNLCGVIGMGLALIGLLLPSLKVSYMGMGMSGTMFEATMWTILPLILIVGACALYVLKYDVAGFLAAVLAAVVFFLIMCIEKAVGKSQVGGYGVGVHFTWGFWIAFLGFMIAIAAPWINKLIFKPQMKQTRQQIDPNMIQGGPGMNQANPYMQQPGQFANQTMNQANPYMQQPGQMPQQANPYMNQMQNQANPYLNQMQNQANPYLNQMQNQAAQKQNQAGQAVDQAEQFVQNMDVPKDPEQ